MATHLENGAAKLTGRVINIQHFCINDGPGIRTNVFLKGCSNRCKWCCNPESIRFKPELAYNMNKCIGVKECGRCLKSPCPEGAFYVLDGADDRVRVNWDLASECGEETVSVCPTGALYLFGHEMTVDEVLADVEQDQSVYNESGGGITLSGGECTLQPEFAAALLQEAHNRGINTAIETAGNAPWEKFRQVVEHADVVLHDHKVTDHDRHTRWVGTDNSKIRANFKRAYEAFPDKTFIARTPVIPGVNDDEEHIRAVLEFIKPYKNVVDYQLLPYHRYGEGKYGFLGRVYELKDFPYVPDETMQRLQAIIDEAFGRTSARPGQTPTPDQAEASAPELLGAAS
jgi:pyruvate formate lyase activating enzyme